MPAVDYGVGASLRASAGVNDMAPHFSPNGDSIVYSSDRSGSADIWIMDADGEHPRPLTDTPMNEFDPRFSADGTLIVYHAHEGTRPPQLWVMDADGSNRHQITSSSEAGAVFPSWAPQGDEVVFTCGTPPALDICVQKVTAGESRIVIGWRHTGEWEPSWHPHGRRIAFVSDTGGDEDIYTSNLYGELLEKLSANSGRDANPTWSPDGEWIAYDSSTAVGEPPHVYVMRADGSKVEQVAEMVSATPAWSPDGKELAFYGETEWGSGIYLVDLATRSVVLLSRP